MGCWQGLRVAELEAAALDPEELLASEGLLLARAWRWARVAAGPISAARYCRKWKQALGVMCCK